MTSFVIKKQVQLKAGSHKEVKPEKILFLLRLLCVSDR